jgi:hypothetical protein
MSDDNLTPVWCDLCAMWVPAEREPHRSLEHMDPHYAADHPAQEETTPPTNQEER